MTALRLELDDDALDALAARVAQRVIAHLEAREAAEDRWLSTAEAGAYLGLSLAAVHRLTAANAIPHEQAAPNARCWFRASDLDAWRRAGEPSNRPAASKLLPTGQNGDGASVPRYEENPA